jgi:hypothetical protein
VVNFKYTVDTVFYLFVVVSLYSNDNIFGSFYHFLPRDELPSLRFLLLRKNRLDRQSLPDILEPSADRFRRRGERKFSIWHL